MIATFVDYEAGNLRSLRAAFERAGAAVEVTQNPHAIASARLIVIPGVGAAASAMAALHEHGLVQPIVAAARRGAHVFGVCVGMQLLFAHSGEGDVDGLALLPGTVTRLTGARRLPHMGWNDVQPLRAHALASALPATCYFAHSFAVQDADPACVVASTPVERGAFASLVALDRVAGAQFHPERSSSAGAALLRDVVAWASDADAA